MSPTVLLEGRELDVQRQARLVLQVELRPKLGKRGQQSSNVDCPGVVYGIRQSFACSISACHILTFRAYLS